MNYERTLIKHKFIEIKDLSTVEYAEISLNERFSQTVRSRCLPSLDTRWNDPKKSVERVYFTNYSGGLSKRFSTYRTNSMTYSSVNIPEQIGDTQWWTTACQFILLPRERIHSTTKMYSGPKANGTRIKEFQEESNFRNNHQMVFLPNSRFSRDEIGEVSLKRNCSLDSIPYFKKPLEKHIEVDHRGKLLEDKLGEHKRDLQIAEALSQPFFRNNRCVVLSPKSLSVTILKRYSFGDDEFDSATLKHMSHNRFSVDVVNSKKWPAKRFEESEKFADLREKLNRKFATIHKRRLFCGDETDQFSLKKTPRNNFSDVLPYSERLVKKRFRKGWDLREKLLGKYVANLKTAKAHSLSTFRNSRCAVLSPKSLLVTLPKRIYICEDDMDTTLEKSSQNRISADVPYSKTLVDKRFVKGQNMRKNLIDDKLHEYMDKLEITKVKPMEV